MIQEFKDRIERLESTIKETTTNGLDFERNVRNEFKLEYLQGHFDLLNKHHDFIGVKVYKSENGFSYYRYMVDTGLNRTETKSVKFTEEMFEQFKQDLCIFIVDRLTDELINCKIVSNSSNQLVNLIFGWHLECKQQLISFYRRFIK